MERPKKPVIQNTTNTIIELTEDTEYNTSLSSVSRFTMGDDKTSERTNNTEALCYVSW